MNLMIQLLEIFSPIIRQLIERHQQANNGAMPTDAEILAAFEANAAAILAEGAAWRASHPA